jgi:hypothetical protein
MVQKYKKFWKDTNFAKFFLGFLGIILNLKIIQKRCKDTTYYGNSQTFWRKKSMTCPLDPWRQN